MIPKQEQLLKMALKGDDRAIIKLTSLIQKGYIENSVTKRILSNTNENNICLCYLEACLYAFGAKVPQSSKKAAEILTPLIKTHNYSYALNLAATMHSEGIATLDIYPSDEYLQKAIDLGNPLAIANYLSAGTDAAKIEFFKLFPKCYPYITNDMQQKLNTIIERYWNDLSQRDFSHDKAEGIKLWGNIAEFYDKAGLHQRAKMAHLMAARLGSANSSSRLIDPIKKLSDRQQMKMFSHFREILAVSIKGVKNTRIKDQSIPKLSEQLQKFKNTKANLELELNLIRILPEMNKRMANKMKPELEMCENIFKNLTNEIDKINEMIFHEMKRQVEIAKQYDIVSDKINEQISEITAAFTVAKQRWNQISNASSDKTQLLRPMQKYLITDLIKRSEELDKIVRTASKSSPAFFSEASSDLDNPKSDENRLILNLRELLNFCKMDMENLPKNADDLLEADCQMIDKWIAFREVKIPKAPTRKFEDAKNEILALRGVLADMKNRITPKSLRHI